MKISVRSVLMLGCVLLTAALCSCTNDEAREYWSEPRYVTRAAVLGPPTSSLDIDGDNSLALYDTPLEWPVPYYKHNTRYYTGGRLETGSYYYQGYYYPNRYYYDGVYLYGGERVGGPDTARKYN